MDTKKHQQITIAQFSKQAGAYTSIPSHSDALDQLVILSGADKQDTVLDVACGSGIVSCAFARHVQHVTGVDMTEAMIREAKKLQAEMDLHNLKWEIGDVTRLPYPDHHFSIVVSRFGFHHFLHPERVLLEMKRVCQPGGIVMVIDVSPPESKIDKYNEMEKNRDPSHVAALSISAFHRLFESSGLKQLKTASYSMQIGLEEQLLASFPADEEALQQMILADIGRNELGVHVTQIEGKVYLNYPIYIFYAQRL